MTTEKTSVSIEYNPDSSSSCAGVLFEIPTLEVIGGDVVEMLLWGMSLAVLEPYILYKGTESMGYGLSVSTTQDEITAIVDFAETYTYQAEYPIYKINNVEAVTEILYIDENGEIVTYATRGENITSKFRRKGYSCLEHIDKLEMYGSVRFKYNRTPYYKKWEWTVPVGSEGLYWFFIYKGTVVTNKFSIELPDLTSGPVDYRNIMLYVTSRISGDVIPNAMVYIDGLYVGSTDDNGGISIDNIQVGSHQIKVTASGYQDTDLDNLSNDTLMVY